MLKIVCPHLLWNGRPQIFRLRLYCFYQCAGRYHLQKQALFYLYERSAFLYSVACREQLQRCLYGIYRKVLEPCLQHSGAVLQCCSRTHPKYVKAIKGKKTGKKDAKWSADIFKHDLVSGSFIPPADIRQLRDLMRYRYKLTNFTVGEKNCVQNCLTVSNFKLDNVFFDVFGKASTNIISHLLENPTVMITDISSFRIKGIKATFVAFRQPILLHLFSELRFYRIVSNLSFLYVSVQKNSIKVDLYLP